MTTNDTPEMPAKVMARRINPRLRTTVVLSLKTSDASALRALASTLTLKGGRTPSMALLARRALAVYGDQLQMARRSQPLILQAEIHELERLATPNPSPVVQKTNRAAVLSDLLDLPPGFDAGRCK